MRTVDELFQLDTYMDRLMYLLLEGSVSDRTFGGLRELNQRFYTSKEWLSVRRRVIARDLGCDMGLSGYEIFGKPYVHHMNPLSPEAFMNNPGIALDTNQLITVSFDTHQRIHYGIRSELQWSVPLNERFPNDTTLWSRRF